MSYTRRFKDDVLPEDHKPTSRRIKANYDYDGKEPRLLIVPSENECCERHQIVRCPECSKAITGKP